MQHCWGYQSCLFPDLSSQETFPGEGVVAGVSSLTAQSSPSPPCRDSRVPGSTVGARPRDSPIRPKLSDKVLRNFFILLIFSADCESIMSHIGGRPPPPARRHPAPPAPEETPPLRPRGSPRAPRSRGTVPVPPGKGALRRGRRCRCWWCWAPRRQPPAHSPDRPRPGLPRHGRTRRAGRRLRRAAMDERQQSPARGCGRRRWEEGRREGGCAERKEEEEPGRAGEPRGGRAAAAGARGGQAGALGPGRGMRCLRCGAGAGSGAAIAAGALGPGQRRRRLRGRSEEQRGHRVRPGMFAPRRCITGSGDGCGTPGPAGPAHRGSGGERRHPRAGSGWGTLPPLLRWGGWGKGTSLAESTRLVKLKLGVLSTCVSRHSLIMRLQVP